MSCQVNYIHQPRCEYRETGSGAGVMAGGNEGLGDGFGDGAGGASFELVSRGDGVGEGDSFARLLFAFAGALLSFVTFGLSIGVGVTAAFGLAFALVVAPAGMRASFCPVAGAAGWTGWPFGSADRVDEVRCC